MLRRVPSPVSLATGLVLAMSLVATAPAWIVQYPPLQDLPLHASALRVIHDYADPSLALGEYFELALGKTAYVLFYLVGSALAPLFGIHGAIQALMAVYLGGVPVALGALARALGKDERLALFAVPLVVNALFLLGLLPFLLGLPLMLGGMAVVVGYVERPALPRGLLLAALGVALFFCHVFPFALFGVVYALVFPWRSPRAWLGAALPALPALGAVMWWSLVTPAGTKAARELDLFRPRPLVRSLAHFSRATTDVFRDASDDICTVLLMGLVVLALGWSRRDARAARPLAARYALVVLVCAAGYLLLGNQLGDIYLLADRFAVPLLFCSIPLLGWPSGGRGWVTSGLAAALGIVAIVNVCVHFKRFEEREVGAFDRALASMEPGQRTVGLMFDRTSDLTYHFPFLHFVSYYQAAKGGLVMFSFAGFAHWPFRFRADRYPPPGRPPRLGWEWDPGRVKQKEIFPYYDYVLVHGGDKKLSPRTHVLQFRDGRWSVWRKLK